MMKKCVEQENLSALVAHGGMEGLRLADENKDNCSLVILDIMMPDLDGFQDLWHYNYLLWLQVAF